MCYIITFWWTGVQFRKVCTFKHSHMYHIHIFTYVYTTPSRQIEHLFKYTPVHTFHFLNVSPNKIPEKYIFHLLNIKRRGRFYARLNSLKNRLVVTYRIAAPIQWPCLWPLCSYSNSWICIFWPIIFTYSNKRIRHLCRKMHKKCRIWGFTRISFCSLY